MKDRVREFTLLNSQMVLPLCDLGHGVPLHREMQAAGELDRHDVVA